MMMEVATVMVVVAAVMLGNESKERILNAFFRLYLAVEGNELRSP